jgi:hypothetical protein
MYLSSNDDDDKNNFYKIKKIKVGWATLMCQGDVAWYTTKLCVNLDGLFLSQCLNMLNIFLA